DEAAAAPTFGAGEPNLGDSPAGAAAGGCRISATVTDADGGSGGGSTSVTVNNTTPTITGLSVTPNPVDENGTVTLTSSFTDPGTQDTHTVLINWGPGEGTTSLNLAAGVLTFSASHQYLGDNPSGTANDVYPISVTLSED